MVFRLIRGFVGERVCETRKSTEVHENSRLGLMIMRAFEHFLRTYRPDDWKGDNPYYVDSMQRATEQPPLEQALVLAFVRNSSSLEC